MQCVSYNSDKLFENSNFLEILNIEEYININLYVRKFISDWYKNLKNIYGLNFLNY